MVASMGHQPITYSDYIVFVDESGDHSLTSINSDWPVFVLCFCIFGVGEYVDKVAPAIRRLKCKTFGHDLVVFHEHDIRKKKGAFAQLNQARREEFLQELTAVVAATDMTIVAVVIDKVLHKRKYTQPYHPYYLAMRYGLERVQHFLRMRGETDAETAVIFEARGAKEDQALELEFRRFCGSADHQWPLRIVVADKKRRRIRKGYNLRT